MHHNGPKFASNLAGCYCNHVAFPGDFSTIRLRMMEIIAILIRTLEVLFVTGAIGSAAVILLSGVEDLETVFEPDEPVGR